MIYRIVILNGSLKGQQITVEEGSTTIGRGGDCAVRLPDDEVAHEHAVMDLGPEGLRIRDLGSMSKILVNHREVHESPLKHGDLVELGRTRILVQAFVQADVHAAQRPTHVSQTLASKLFMLGILGATVVFAAVYYWRASAPVEPAPPPRGSVIAPDTAAVAATITNAPPVAELPSSKKNPPQQTAMNEPAVLPIPAEASNEVPPVTDVPVEPLVIQPASGTTNRDAVVEKPSGVAQGTQTAPPFATNAAVGPEPEEATNRPAIAVEGVRQKAEGMLAQARLLLTENRLTEADSMMRSIEILDADFLPPYQERARLFERRRMLDPAMDQWIELIHRATGTALEHEAAAACDRLDAARRQLAAPFSGQIRIVSIEQSKFPDSADFDEMRALDIRLASTALDTDVDSAAVRIEVAFFDKDPSTGAVRPSRVQQPKDPPQIRGAWEGGTEKSVATTYIVPKGAAAEKRAGPYYGFTVRVLYYGALQDVAGRPQDLSEQTVRGPGRPAP